ncbi:uncharacterized protein LOC127663389 [Xyrauchen texanus]|uniref:uncharacterized protein LOC127663389 n=1 Tax=Xyrauchen texanus TaxID=154827 RepID=UPI002241E123|nr:uncharacterized protein LOC127663389 [Xyrauchen texanus]
MSDKTDHSEDEERKSVLGVTVVETNRFGFILGNGEIDSDGPCPELVRHRETKWLSLIKQWEQVMEKKSSKVKSQCQKGIPASVRAKCWPLLCGAMERMKKNEKLYERLVEAPDQQGWTDIIKRDTDRQFPFHEMFQSKDGHGQKDLLQVLKAYTQYRPEEGYCQAQGPVAAVLLMNMPAEEAFWCLVQICELYLPGYYSPLLEGVLFDAAVLSSVLKKLCPAAHKHLQNQGVEPLMFATDWLMCLYSRHLPFNTLLRVWDLFFCYGVRVLFQVAVVLVRRCLGQGRLRKECEGQMETLERLRGVKERVQHDQADTFIHEVCSVPLSLADLQKQTEKETEKWKVERPDSTFDLRGRCHGYRMAWERGQENQTENEKDRQRWNLSLPLMRSHSSLTPSILQKKWRKRSSRTETEEWDGGGRTFSQGLIEESDDGDMRRRSVCGVIGEQKPKQDRLVHELYTHKQKDHRTHTTISPQKPKGLLVDSSSIESDVFEDGHKDTICRSQLQSVTERDSVAQGDTFHTDTGHRKEETEVSLNQHNDTSDTEQCNCDDKERIAAGMVEEDIQIHEHHVQNVEKETCQVIQNTEDKTHQNEQNVEIKITSESCEECIQTNYDPREEYMQTDTGKQEEQIESDSIIQEDITQKGDCKCEGAETDTLQKVTIPEDNQQDEENIPNLENITEKEVQTPVVQEDQRSHTSREEQYEEQTTGENHTVGKEEAGFQHEVVSDGDILEKREKGKEEERKVSNSDDHIGEKETLQTSEVLPSSSLETKETAIEHPDISVSPHGLADPVHQSQSSVPEQNYIDTTVIFSDSDHSPVDSKKVEVILGYGNTEQSEVCASGETNFHETWEDVAVASKNSKDINLNAAPAAMCGNIKNSEINTEHCGVNKTAGSENIMCCEMYPSEKSSNLGHNEEDDTCRSGEMDSNEMHVEMGSGDEESKKLQDATGSANTECIHIRTGSGNHESKLEDSFVGSGKPEFKDVHAGVGYGNPENDTVESAGGSGNPECKFMHFMTVSSNPESNAVHAGTGNPECKEVHADVGYGNPECIQITTESGIHESNVVDSVVGSVNPENDIVESVDGSGNPECKFMHVMTEYSNSESNAVHVGTGNPECKEVHGDVGYGNPECIQITTESGIHESNVVDSVVGSVNPENDIVESVDGSGNQDCKFKHVMTEYSNSESNAEHVGTGNPECKEVHADVGYGNPECIQITTECGIHESNVVDSVVGSANPENDTVESANGSGNPECKFMDVMTESSNPESNEVHVGTGSSNTACKEVQFVIGFGNPENKDVHVGVGYGNSEGILISNASDNEGPVVDSAVRSGNPECNMVDTADGSGNPLHNIACAITDKSQDVDSTSSKTTSKSSTPRSSYPTILSEDTFRVPKQTLTSKEDSTQETHTLPISGSPTKTGAHKCLGLFRRLRGETNKIPIPKILIQDFSEKEEKLTAKERRQRKRERERKECKKDRKKQEKEMEKDTEKERKKPQTRGKSFQVLNRKCGNKDMSSEDRDSQTFRHRSNSAPFSDSNI